MQETSSFLIGRNEHQVESTQIDSQITILLRQRGSNTLVQYFITQLDFVSNLFIICSS